MKVPRMNYPKKHQSYKNRPYFLILMNINQAFKILDYGTVPTDRDGQEELIRIRYNTLNRRPLYSCSDKQIYAVARRLFIEAAVVCSKLELELAGINQEIRLEECQENYNRSLYAAFNINPDSWVDHSELERQLLE